MKRPSSTHRKGRSAGGGSRRGSKEKVVYLKDRKRERRHSRSRIRETDRPASRFWTRFFVVLGIISMLGYFVSMIASVFRG